MEPQNQAPVAQLDRASDYESEGRAFESLRARHDKTGACAFQAPVYLSCTFFTCFLAMRLARSCTSFCLKAALRLASDVSICFICGTGPEKPAAGPGMLNSLHLGLDLPGTYGCPVSMTSEASTPAGVSQTTIIRVMTRPECIRIMLLQSVFWGGTLVFSPPVSITWRWP